MPEIYKLKFTPLSFFGTILQSDTLFGTMCWAVKHLEGEKKLTNMLCSFADRPPFLISSAMPEGYLPKPALPEKDFQYDATVSKNASRVEMESAKEQKRTRWAGLDFFQENQATMSRDIKFPSDRSKTGKDAAPDLEYHEFDLTRNAVSRTTLTALDGALFSDSYFYVNNGSFAVYLKILDGSYTKSWFGEIFHYIALSGIGKNKSTGKGLFKIDILEPDVVERKIFSFRGTHFLSISLCAGSNLYPLAYSTLTKYGKVGDEFSQSGINGKLIAGKKPIVFYNEGASFHAAGDAEFPGMLVKNIHDDPRIVQYGFAFPVYFNYK